MRVEPRITPLGRETESASGTYGPIGAGVILTALILLFYNSYRYPLRINDSSTSPTYSDTPVAFQITKYAIFILIAYLVVTLGSLQLRRGFSIRRQVSLLFLLAWSAGLAAFHGVHSGTMASLVAVSPLVFVVPVAVFARAWMARTPNAERVGRLLFHLLALVLVLHSLANVVEIVLWRATGRLPALGYAGGVVRFGGIWDDPNQCATFSALMIVAVASGRFHIRRGPRAWLVLAGLFNVGVSISYSAFVVLYVGLVMVWAVRSRNRILVVYAALGVLAVGAVALPAFVSNQQGGAVPRIIQQKNEGSIVTRLRVLEEGGSGSLPETAGGWLIGEDAPKHSETAFVLWLNATGVPGLALLLGWLGTAFRVAFRSPERVWALPVAGALAFGSLLVPYVVIFPLGPLFVLMVSLLAGSSQQHMPALP